MTTTVAPATETTPTRSMLEVSLLVGPLVYLVADTLYATRGWDDPSAGIVHVLGAVGYGLVVLAVAARLPRSSRLAAALVFIGLVGMAGNVAYGFEAIHTSYGDLALVDRDGAAAFIKPLGLFVPLSFALMALALVRIGRRWQAALVAVAVVAWPVAHIGNVGSVAVGVNLVLVVAFGSLAWSRP